MTANNEKPELIPIDSGFSVLYQGKFLYSKRSPQKNILQLIQQAKDIIRKSEANFMLLPIM